MRKIVIILKFIIKIISQNSFLNKAVRIAFHKFYKNKGNFFYYENNKLSFLVHRNETISNSIFLDGEFEFSNKWMGWEQTTKRDKETGQLILDVKMPTVPGIDEVLKNAERFYEFVNGTSKQETKE